MESKFDYLTLTLKPESNDVYQYMALNTLKHTMLLGDLMHKMTLKGRFAFYDFHLSYENIHLLFTTPDKFREQGLCLRISAQGLDYLRAYLKSYGIDLKEWLGMWRALCFKGYITKDTRLDYAMDDIRYNGEMPLLTMRKVLRCKANREICKKARTIDIVNGDELGTRERTKFINGEEVKGMTVYVGVRQSESFIRFYDKLAEHKQQRKEIPEGCTHWTRCELELKGSAAMSALNAYLDMPEKDFAEYMRGVFNDHCRFISRTSSNISRCPVKRWWREFLQGCTERFRLPHHKPARSALARADRGLSQYVPTIFTMIREYGIEGFLAWYDAKVDKFMRQGKTLYKSELADNIREDIRDYEEMNAFKHYAYTAAEDGELEERIRQQHWDYFQKFYNVVRCCEFDEQHRDFMNGQEVFDNGV
ncbi:MAG: replication initiation factor domain-containing protein [Lachnospiraceae bacterium]|nr:replication initiation factor domain-containing protein [Ruminococcus sp.]MCM1275652.1 replication initiation factor domain-containing protein [Lachnospiraceae bacterium]